MILIGCGVVFLTVHHFSQKKTDPLPEKETIEVTATPVPSETEEPAQEAVQGVLQGAAPELLLPGLEVIIMKQDVLPPADMVEDAGVRISGRSRLAE